MPSEEKLDAAKQQLKARYFGAPGVLGFGIGDGVVRVYLLNEESGHDLPHNIDGIDIECIVTGEIIAG